MKSRITAVLSLVPNSVLLAEVLGFDDEVGHRRFEVLRFKC
jgi:hypothetical protein